MKNGYQHDTMLLSPLKAEFTRRSLTTRLEAPVRSQDVCGFIDLLVESDGRRLAIEAELSAKRVERDLAKAAAVKADELWIVVSEPRVAKAVRRKLAALHIRVKGRRISVLTQGQALARVKQCFPLISVANSTGKHWKTNREEPCVNARSVNQARS